MRMWPHYRPTLAAALFWMGTKGQLCPARDDSPQERLIQDALTHAELLERDGAYARLYAAQFADGKAELFDGALVK